MMAAKSSPWQPGQKTEKTHEMVLKAPEESHLSEAQRDDNGRKRARPAQRHKVSSFFSFMSTAGVHVRSCWDG